MAPTLAHADGFEFGVLSTATHTGATALYESITNATIDTAQVRTGSRSLRLNPTASAQATISHAVTTGSSKVVQSFGVRIGGSLPSSRLRMARIVRSSTPGFVVYDPATGQFGLQWTGADGVTPVGPTVVADRWYLIDWVVDMSTTTFTESLAVDGGTPVTKTVTQGAAGTFSSVALGTNSTSGPAAAIYYDDWIIGHDTTEFPYGDHAVRQLLPNADGTHNAGTNVMEDNAGTDIGAVAAWSLVNEIPPESSTYVRQAALDATKYAELAFEDPTTASVWAVVGYQASFASGTASLSATSRLVDSSGTTLGDVFAGDMSDTTLRYLTSTIAPPSGGWTASILAGAKARIGFASSVGSVPRWATLTLQYVSGGVQRALIGSATGTSTASGHSRTALRFHGAATVEQGYVDPFGDDYSGDTVASLTVVLGSVKGTATGSSAASGLLSSAPQLEGLATGTSAAEAAFSGGAQALVGSASGTSTGFAVLRVVHPIGLVGSGTGTSTALGQLLVNLGGSVPAPFAIWASDARPVRWDSVTRPERWDANTRPVRWFTTVFVREDRSVALTFVAYGPFTENEIPEALLIKVLRPLRNGGTTTLDVFDQTPAYTATVSIQPPTGSIDHRTAEIMDPADLPTDYPDDFTDPEQGWVRVTWEDGDFPDDGTYSVQVTLDNGDVRLKSTDVWRPEVNVGPASAVGL